MRIVVRRDVLIDERWRVDVVHDQIQPAVVVEIGVGGAVREALFRQPPVPRLVDERQVAGVPKDIVGLIVAGKLLEHLARPTRRSRAAVLSRGESCIDVIEVVGRLRISVADEEVLVSVVVEVGE